MKIVSRYYRQICKQTIKESTKLELETIGLEITTAKLHENIENSKKQGDLIKLRYIMEDIKI